ncbi:hypothetical protein BDZ45DRAFT_668833 [Acephala macrosclerotiorum]|nr:hypothetical protein BDZ45DRAFT_668833 [Acephala macrosclerotiorum]
MSKVLLNIRKGDVDRPLQILGVNNPSDFKKLKSIMKKFASLDFDNPSDLAKFQSSIEEAGLSLVLPSEFAGPVLDSPTRPAELGGPSASPEIRDLDRPDYSIDTVIVKATLKVDIEILGSTVKGDAPTFIALEHTGKINSAETKEILQYAKEIVESGTYAWHQGQSLESFKENIEENVKEKLGGIGLNVKSVIIGEPKERRQWAKGLLAGITAVGSIAAAVIEVLRGLGVL